MSSKTGSQTKLTVQLQNLQQQLLKLKQPFLKQANQTAKQFQEKVREHGKKIIENQQNEQKYYPESNQIKPITLEYPEQKKLERPKILLEEKVSRSAEPNWQEWRSNVEHGFKDYEEIVKNYDDVIYKKQKVKKAKNDQVIEDFRADERQMVLQIYEQLKDHKNLTVSFKAIQEFFQNYDLFYYFYNIHPYRLIGHLKQSAKKFHDKLTKQQFVDFFLIDRPNVAEFKTATEKKLSGVCILPEQIWKKLKSIFDTLDTFGDEKICIKTLFQKIKSNPSSLSLLSSEAIQFPEIGRVYTLQKILFDLENKYQFQNKVDWQTIQDTIIHFNHIQEPALDIIFSHKIQRAQITKDSNYFLLEPNALNIIKEIFNRCPKHYGFFVKTSFFTYELLESGILKPYLSQATRLEKSTKNSYLTLEYIIKNFSKQAPQYIDLDEMLELISIKGCQNFKKLINLYDKVETESSQQQTEQRRNQRRLKKIKSLEDLKKNKKRDKKKPVCQITKIKQFNLFERQTPTIRQLKVQQMIEQKQRQDEIELNKKFKANPIPVSLNTERYQRYLKLLQQKKQAILNRLGMKRQEEQIIIDYLKSNTKLFEERKTKKHCGQAKPNYRFQASPLPAHISEELLPKIQSQKQERRKRIEEQTKKKYEQIYWKQMRNSLENEKDDESLLEKINSIQQEKRKGKPIKPTQVPNFEELHKRFQQQLQNRRLKFSPTEIKQFKLSFPKTPKVKQNLSPQPHQFKSVSPPKFTSNVEIKSTKKYDDWVAFNQARLAEKQFIDLQKQKQEEERHIKQKNFAKFMRKYLDNCSDNTELLKHKSQAKLKNHRQNVKMLEQKTGNQLAQIYARVLQRPFLFEEASKTRKPPKQKPTKVQIQSNVPEHQQGYPYKQGIFEKEGSQYHPVESENLNQSF